MDLDVELNNEDTKRNKFQVVKNVSFDPRATVVIAAIACFVLTQNPRPSLHFQECEKCF